MAAGSAKQRAYSAIAASSTGRARPDQRRTVSRRNHSGSRPIRVSGSPSGWMRKNQW